MLVEGAATVDIKNNEDRFSTDENKNEEGVSTEKEEDKPVEETEEKTTPEEKEDTNMEEQTLQSNEQEETREVPEGKEIQGDQESGESSQDTEKGVSGEEALVESPETSEAVEQENSSKEMNNEIEVSENAEENVDARKEEDGSHPEIVIPIESSEKESQDVDESTSDHVEAQDERVGAEGNEPEKDSLEGGGDLNPQEMETSTLGGNEDEKTSNDTKEQTLSQEIDNELSVSEENKNVSEEVDVPMETSKHSDEGHGEEPKIEDGVEPDVSLLTETEIKNSDDEILQPKGTPAEVTEDRDTNDSLEVGEESSMVEKNADTETDQVNTSNQVETDEGKANEDKPVMEEDNNVLVVKNEAANLQVEESIEGSPAPTLEEELDMKLDIKRRKSKCDEIQAEGNKICLCFVFHQDPLFYV